MHVSAETYQVYKHLYKHHAGTRYLVTRTRYTPSVVTYRRRYGGIIPLDEIRNLLLPTVYTEIYIYAV